MTDTVDEHGRTDPPLVGSEWETLTGFLDYQRATLAWKTGGLDAEQLGRTVAASTMTLGGLLKHMAYVEDAWFGRWLWDKDREPWASVNWEADEDWDWHSAGPGVRGACVGRRRSGTTGRASLAGRPWTEPALDPHSHDRGVRPAQRPRRPDP